MSSVHDQTPHKGLIAWWARNPIAANLLMVVAFAAGIIGFLSMEREVFPAFPWNGVSVSVAWPGASPQEVEEQIVLRMEEALADLDGIENLTATAGEGFASVNVEAKRTVDMTAFVDEVKLRVDGVSNLPRESFPPIVQRWQAQDTQWILTIYGSADRRVLQRVAREVRDDVSQIPGASLSQLWARQSEEVSIEVSRRRCGAII